MISKEPRSVTVAGDTDATTIARRATCTPGRTTTGVAERTIYAAVRAIPRVGVATYGEIAKLAGIPSGHRVVARAMRTCPESLPWYRVIGKKDARRGQINIGDAEHADFQRARLEAEGVEFDADGYVPRGGSGCSRRRFSASLEESRATSLHVEKQKGTTLAPKIAA